MILTGILCVFHFQLFAQENRKSRLIQRVDSINATSFQAITSNPAALEASFLENRRIADSLNYKEGLAKGLSNLSLLYYYLGDYDISLEYSLNAIRLFEEQEMIVQAGREYTELGNRIKRNDLENGERYMRTGIRILKTVGDLGELSSAYNNYGGLKMDKQEFDSALFFVNKSLDLKKELRDTLGVAYSLAYLGNIYSMLGNDTTALGYFTEAYTSHEAANDSSGMGIALINIGSTYTLLENYVEALRFMKKSNSIAEAINYINLAEFSYSAISETFEKMGVYDSALYYNKVFNRYSDSLRNDRTNQRIAELQVQFETEEKEKELAQKTAELSIEQLRVKRRNWISGILSTLFISVSFISFLFVRNQKIKRETLERENKLKFKLADAEAENRIHKERERISKDLHDNVGSQITNLITGIEISNLHLKKDQQDKALSLLENLDADARGAMTDLRETIWLLDKKAVHFSDFLDHLKSYLKRQENYLKGLTIDLNSSVNSDRILNPTQSVNLTRVIQEVLNNTRKYSEATEFKINFSEEGGRTLISLCDNGIGMDLESSESKGNGLKNIRSRIVEIEGSVLIDSSPDNGTSIKISF